MGLKPRFHGDFSANLTWDLAQKRIQRGFKHQQLEMHLDVSENARFYPELQLFLMIFIGNTMGLM